MKKFTDIDKSRYEFKYRISYHDYLQIRNSIKRFMKKDEFTSNAEGRGYLVRSLYFDTLNYDAYHEKTGGDNQRNKLRIRTYDIDPTEKCVIRAELKQRRSNLVIKYSSFVTYGQYLYFEGNNIWNNEEDNTVLTEFNRHLKGRCFQPMVLVEYLREGYKTAIKNDLRITFDHEVKSKQSKTLFPPNLNYRKHYDSSVIMEVKFKDQIPVWLKSLIHQHGLKIIANSKFTQAIQLSRKELIHPGGIIYVR